MLKKNKRKKSKHHKHKKKHKKQKSTILDNNESHKVSKRKKHE